MPSGFLGPPPRSLIAGNFGLAGTADNVNWIAQTSPLYGVQDIDWCYDRFVMVGGGVNGPTIAYSTTGAPGSWTVVSTPWDGGDGTFWGVKYSPTSGRTVAVGRQNSGGPGLIIYSDDAGVTWTATTTPFDAVVSELRAVDYSVALGTFLTVGLNNSGSRRGMESADGVTWTSITTPWDFTSGETLDCAWDDYHSQWIVVGYHSTPGFTVMTSPDLVTWTEQVTPWDGLAFYEPNRIAVSLLTGRILLTLWGSGGSPDIKVAYSDDGGVTWVDTGISTPLSDGFTVSWGPYNYPSSSPHDSVFIVGGTGATGYFNTGADGLTFDTKFVSGFFGAFASIVGGYTFVPTPTSNFIVVACVDGGTGHQQLMWTEDDGATWTRATGIGTSYAVNRIKFRHGIWMCGDSLGNIYTSADGKAWTLQASLPGMSVYDLEYGNGNWIVVGTSQAWISADDGATWTLLSLGVTWSGATRMGVVFGAANWVIGGGTSSGTQPTLVTSTDDGVTWTPTTLPNVSGQPMDTAEALVYANGTITSWGSVDNSPFLGAVAYSTDDGVTWTRVISGLDPSLAWRGLHLTTDGTVFLAAGEPFRGTFAANPQYSSTDGFTWGVVSTPWDHENWRDTTYDGARFFMAGHADVAGINPTVLLTSPDLTTWTALSIPTGATADASAVGALAAPTSTDEWTVGYLPIG